MWYQTTPEQISIEEANVILLDTEAKELFPNQYNALLDSVKERIAEFKDKSKRDNELAWVQPSYEQTLKLNCWLYGIDYIVDFDANRIGKTAGGVLNALLWILPNDPDWMMFQSFTDHKGRTFKTIPRPSIHLLKGYRKALQDANLQGDPRKPLDAPENLACYKFYLKHQQTTNPKPNNAKRTIWVGGPSQDWNKKNVMKEWLKWTPKANIEKFSEYDGTLKLTYETNSKVHPTHEVEVLFKSYDMEDTKWSGGAVDGIMMSEGIPASIFNEIRQRYKYPAFASWDYTPYEARNTGGKAALAYKVFKGEEPLPLHPTIYEGFGIEDCPDYIMDEEKREDLIKNWQNKPEGEARIKGKFFSSSPIVLKHYDPKFHALHISFVELRKMYAPKPLILFRGLDPGWGHMTACAFMALASDNTKYIFRYYTATQRTISERTEDIIILSGNKKVQHPRNPKLWQEQVDNPENKYQMTWLDFHSFKTDETTGVPYANNYIKEGLIVRPSLTLGPKERAVSIDDMLKPQLHLPHPITKKTPGGKLFFLVEEPGVAEALQRMQNIFWGTYEKGEKKGLTKDTIQDYDDDELDGLCYVALPELRYESFVRSQNTMNPDQRQLFNSIKFA
jgi:hypothetical protein